MSNWNLYNSIRVVKEICKVDTREKRINVAPEKEWLIRSNKYKYRRNVERLVVSGFIIQLVVE